MHVKFLPTSLDGMLGHVIEEAGEVQQIAGKIIRFGWGNHNPNSGITNIEAMKSELRDSIHASQALLKELEEGY